MLADIEKATHLDYQGIASLSVSTLHRSQVSRWARDKARPDHDKLRDLCDGVRRAHPELASLADDLWQAAGYGEPAPLPAIVRDNWSDPMVRGLWDNTAVSAERRITAITSYLDAAALTPREEQLLSDFPGAARRLLDRKDDADPGAEGAVLCRAPGNDS